jgi:hypothetical protein
MWLRDFLEMNNGNTATLDSSILVTSTHEERGNLLDAEMAQIR